MAARKITKMRIWAGLILLVAALILYLFTLDNGLRPDELTGGDLITHQYAQAEGRPGNAPGYPLYTMGGWLWFRLGQTLLGWALNPIQILSFYSTLYALASLLVLYLILLRVSHSRWPLALLLAAFFGTTYFFWYYSVTTEQYTSAVLQTLLVIWLAFKWDEAPRDSYLLWLAFICGTMLANMVTTLFMLPLLFWFIFFRRDGRNKQQFFLFSYLKQPGFVLKIIGVTLLPLLAYAYIYLRGAQHPEWRGVGQWSSTWDWFGQFLTIQQGRDELGWGLAASTFFTDEFPALMWRELTGPVFFGGLLGLVFLGRRRAIFLYGTLVIYFIFSWGYRLGNWFQVIIPAYPIFVIGFATGLTKIIEMGHRRLSKSAEKWLYAAIVVLLSALLVFRFTTNIPRANQRNLLTDTGLEPGWAILADNPERPAVISGVFAERVALQYLTTVWGVEQIYPADAGDLRGPPEVHETDVITYLSREAIAVISKPVLNDRHPQAAGKQLIALWSSPRTKLPANAIPLDIDFGRHLKLVGWEQVETGSGGSWQIALYWQAADHLENDYTVSVRPLLGGELMMAAGEPLIQDHQPVWGAYPTSRWQPGEIVRDGYALELPVGIKPNAAQIVVYWVTETGFENLAEVTLDLSK